MIINSSDHIYLNILFNNSTSNWLLKQIQLWINHSVPTHQEHQELELHLILLKKTETTYIKTSTDLCLEPLLFV